MAQVSASCVNDKVFRVFRSHCNILYQGMWYLLAFIVVTFVVNSINCVWVTVAGHFVPSWLYSIGTTVLSGGVSMAVFFVVNKIVFSDARPAKEKLDDLFHLFAPSYIEKHPGFGVLRRDQDSRLSRGGTVSRSSVAPRSQQSR